jgi:2-oxoglutarate dehydrogenase E2 component (dihydrolipoamide succinyltransferase)
MAIELTVPAVGESITEVEIGAWLKQPGQPVAKDEPLVALESEKATVELPSPEAGVLTRILKNKGEVARIGEVIAVLEPGGSAKSQAKHPPPTVQARPPDGATDKSAVTSAEPRVMPAAQAALAAKGLRPEQVQPTGPGGRVLKEDVLRTDTAVSGAVREPPAPETTDKVIEPTPELARPAPSAQEAGPGREEETVPMSRLRRTVAERLVQAQHTAALLTTFNEIDMSAVTALRKEHGEAFQKTHGVKLGFMSFFVKACVDALKAFPVVNAEVRGTSIVYHNYCDIGVAVGGGKGLVVPVLRNAEHMSFADVEKTIADFALRARENKLKVEELRGGTFTISNGGVYGSLLSTPIINPPQSGVLGMHSIQERPVAREGNVIVRPMMYVALTYDHRIVDGREAVSFLRRIKDVIETPARMLMEI